MWTPVLGRLWRNMSSKRKHRKRVKERRCISVSKPKKNKHIKYILISFFTLTSVLILFRIFFVKKIEMSTVISVKDITIVSEGGRNTYYRYSKRGPHIFELKYPAVYKIKAISETGEHIIFETTEPNQYWYNGKFAIKYTSYKIFNKTSIKTVERLSYY